MKPLLTVAPPDPEFTEAVLTAPGGFVWWYTDMLDADLNGLVLIWSFGLPFLPGYASAARRGAAQLPGDRPSVNVAVIERGRAVCYVLHELDRSDAQWEGSTWRFGDSTFATSSQDGVRSLDVVLDVPLPGRERLEGTVKLQGVTRLSGPLDAAELRHDWAPLTGPARTSVRLAAGGETYHFDGPGYFDGNVGSQPLHASGIASWTWGRVLQHDRQLIYYLLWDDDGGLEATGVEIDADGALSRFTLEVDDIVRARGRAGLRYPRTFELRRDGKRWAEVRTREVLDDGPFYLRYVIDTEHGSGLGEYCRTDRIDLARHRPLVRMRVQHSEGRNSFWLPLFSGNRSGRIKRLLNQLVEP